MFSIKGYLDPKVGAESEKYLRYEVSFLALHTIISFMGFKN